MTSNAFAQDQTAYCITIQWKHGFTHSYDQLLNDKQLASEQQRLSTYRWIEHVEFLLLQ